MTGQAQGAATAMGTLTVTDTVSHTLDDKITSLTRRVEAAEHRINNHEHRRTDKQLTQLHAGAAEVRSELDRKLGEIAAEAERAGNWTWFGLLTAGVGAGLTVISVFVA